MNTEDHDPDLPPDDPADAGAFAGTVRYPLDWAEYWRAREICWRAVTGTLFLRLVPSAGVIGLITALVLLGLGIAAELAPFFILFSLGFLSTGLFRRRAARREFRRLADVGEVEVEWGSERVRICEGPREPRSFAWSEVRVVLLTAAGFHVQPRRDRGVWVPYSGFEHPADADRFEECVRANEVSILDRRSVG